MRLVTRFSAFFLTALALVLVGFSTTVYLVAQSHLFRELDERLERALDTLEASVDIEPGGLEWEPTDRRIALGLDLGQDEVRWAVRDGEGTLVDRSANAGSGGFPAGWEARAWPTNPPDGTVVGKVAGWRMAGRRMPLKALLRLGRGHPDDEPGYEVQYPVLVLIAGLRPGPVKATLNQLGATLVLLSLGIWLLALAGGRLLARRALAPLTRMAETVSTMSATDLGRRVPTPRTDDELDALGQAFNGLLDRLNEAFDKQQRFAGDASHQLRTPLAALLGQVQLAQRRERPVAEYRQVLDRVLEEGMRLRVIVETLLSLAQPEPPSLLLCDLDLAEWLPHHLERWADHPRAADLRLEVTPNPLAVRVHPPMLAQLLDNLIDNATKYSEPGTPILVRGEREGSSIVLGVEDRGRGLSTEESAHIFDPFFRAEGARNEGLPGNGLGLTVARRIASALHGTLSLTSRSDQFTRFTLRLPERPVPTNVSPGIDTQASV
ncbi:Signal transduction histidine kinase [Singulisphaera sp. GP187]|uniref:sensor histidine kinase n=1 Tax=Singulisphaera sp. GP187 TaxID=1882752 RepID=UPI00092B1BEB|nr:ATP-binding protein [Singulisphaera sp. GP187]SIO62505.1 Signal transduction histidine kinase [Singulisphaera sp. GP187]